MFLNLLLYVKFSRWQMIIFFFFFQKIGFDISCKLSPKETICMEFQSLFSWKNKKNYFKMTSAKIFTQLARCKCVWTLTFKRPRKPASENVVCLCRLLNILANFPNLFLHTGKQCGPWSDCSLGGAVWSGSTLFAKMTFKSTSRWQSRRQIVVTGALRAKGK